MIPDNELWNDRTYPHPVAAVWSAFTTPAKLDRWWGPDGFVTTTASMDHRVGGTWIFEMKHPIHGAFPNRHRYLEIVPHQRIVYLLDNGDDATPHVYRVECSFVEVDGGTRVTMRMIFADAAEVARVKTFGAVEGGRQTFAHLAAFLDAEAAAAAA